ncbi:type IA DNA topoisomerase [Hymenobacter properus]|uniref:DNA topoisomerase n=1 Tax=Hymenobacter properus TaxID=2791026 RepID=A0A931FKQ4_9BACT|nr:type IA DNA topoisomerase [Hymenobacter properus]MBF9144177.1 DNA topoisomerase 3 [Hymenobacter properus]MBR7722994.1 DNA topoisomerase 3 [Microvirga sp. SRT04]
MIVCIAEKPSVAREIANVLGATRRLDGYMEGNGYQVTWTFGHFCQLKEPDDYQPEWKRWSLHNLPMIPDKFGIKLMRRDEGVVKQFHTIKKLVDEATEVINCGDAGQEGEVIQRWVLQEAKCRKPVKRLWISSLTEEAIRQGFANLRDAKEFDSLYQAGKSRAVGDWLLGLNATRLFTLKYTTYQDKQLLSIGRVQTPTLALLVERWHEIQNFKPEPYWVLKTEYRGTLFSHMAAPDKAKDADAAPDTKSRLRALGYFVTEEEARAALEAVRPAPLRVTDVEIKKGRESPPRLFDLTSLQVQCNNQLGLSAEDTLKIVQALYEKKAVSYPRVDTTFLPDDQYAKIPGILRGIGYDALTAPLLATKIPKTPKVFNNNKVTDHHAIIPTGAAGPGGGMETSVYDIIARRFIAAFYPDCEVSNTTVLAEAAERPFRVRGRQILNPGWRVVYGDPTQQAAPKPAPAPGAAGAAAEADDDAVSTVLPNFVKGESGPHDPRLESKMTQPPKDYTEATLLRGMETAGRNIDDEEMRQAMKENGIGRPSTRAAIIETLFKRNYIRREKKRIVPTPTGIELIGLIRNPTLKSAELTGQWEHKLRQIERGELSSEGFLGELSGLVKEMVAEVKNDGRGRMVTSGSAELAVQQAKTSAAAGGSKVPAGMTGGRPATPHGPATLPGANGLGYCPACKTGHVVRGKTAFGCVRFREGCQFRLPAELHGKKLSDPQVKALLAKGRTPVMKGFIGADGQKFDAAIGLDTNFQPLLLQVAESKPGAAPDSGLIPCPVCKLGTMLKGKAAYGCSRFREDCQFRVAFEWGGKQLTETQLKQLLRKGETSVIKGFISAKTGKKYDAALKVEDGRVVPVFG